jgi:hypothetical protein
MSLAPLYKQIAESLQALRNCEAALDKSDWRDVHKARIERLVYLHMPGGSGFDNGTKLDFDSSTPEKLVFNTAFHHMDDSGYIGWTDHRVIVTPSLAFEINLRITGRNRRDVKDFIHECFATSLKLEF